MAVRIIVWPQSASYASYAFYMPQKSKELEDQLVLARPFSPRDYLSTAVVLSAQRQTELNVVLVNQEEKEHSCL